MKTKITNEVKTETYKKNQKNFKFCWIFMPDGVSIQKHDERDYSNFLNRNYISKSNIDLNLSY